MNEDENEDEEFELLPAGEMREKYGLTRHNRPEIKLDPNNVPPALRHLIPYAEKYGIADDLIREDFIDHASPKELAYLKQVLEDLNPEMDKWLAGPEADSPEPTAEYVAFSAMRLGVVDGSRSDSLGNGVRKGSQGVHQERRRLTCPS